MSDIDIKPLDAPHRAAWERLYAAYADFYRVAQTPEMRGTVWSWMQSPGHEVRGVGALREGELVGFAHFRPFARPLSASVGGFLDDLFVDPAHRGSGAADALIAAVADEGRRQGWSVIRWITAADNARARKLYDRVAARTEWVTYDIRL